MTTTPSKRTTTAPAKTGAQTDVDAAVEQTMAVIASGAGAVGEAPLKAAPNLVTELNNIDFKTMIGGPLQAAVDAQVASSLATINFINQIGFTQPDQNGQRELVMVDLSYKRTELDPQTNQPTDRAVEIKVPLLSMLPIPSLRIEHVIVDFNVKLNSVERTEVSDELKIGAEVGGGFGPVNFKVTASYQRKSTTNVEVKKEYSLNVNVKAVQDEMPAGLERVLGLLGA